jgi:hypothetical protein
MTPAEHPYTIEQGELFCPDELLFDNAATVA